MECQAQPCGHATAIDANLKHLVVNIQVDNVNDDLLCGIPHELEVMGTKNIIESITIGIKVQADARSSSRGDAWGRLDEVLTTPGWFALKQVSLAQRLLVTKAMTSWKWRY
jgi:hypothetical protein